MGYCGSTTIIIMLSSQLYMKIYSCLQHTCMLTCKSLCIIVCTIEVIPYKESLLYTCVRCILQNVSIQRLHCVSLIFLNCGYVVCINSIHKMNLKNPVRIVCMHVFPWDGYSELSAMRVFNNIIKTHIINYAFYNWLFINVIVNNNNCAVRKSYL